MCNKIKWVIEYKEVARWICFAQNSEYLVFCVNFRDKIVNFACIRNDIKLIIIGVLV